MSEFYTRAGILEVHQYHFNEWLERYDNKHPKVAACLARERDELLATYNFPAVH